MRRLSLRLVVLCLVVCAAAASRADDLILLNTPEEAVKARMDMIRQTGHEWLISAFTWGDDAATKSLLARARRAAREGVAVKVLTDGLYNHIPKHIQAALVDAGVEIREFHPVRLNMRVSWLNWRMHDKVNIFDGQHFIVGGRNMEAGYFGLPGSKFNWLDRDVLVKNGSYAVKEARDYWMKLWNSAHVEPVRVNRMAPAEVLRGSADLDYYETLYDRAEKETYANVELPEAITVDPHRVKFLHVPVLPWTRTPLGISQEILKLINDADESVIATSPYIVPPAGTMDALQRLKRRGVRFEVFTNSLETADAFFPAVFYSVDRHRLSELGVHINELTGDSTSHAKCVVVDQKRSYIGSFNLNARSSHLDNETGVIVDSPEFAQALENSMRQTYFGRSKYYAPGSAAPPTSCERIIHLFALPLRGNS